MKDVQFFAPNDINDVVKLLAKYERDVTILAGGTDLVPKINTYQLRPGVMVYIGGLGLDYIKEEKGKLVIGATTTVADLAVNSLVNGKAGALAEAARKCGVAATRTTATIGGNLATASPAADLVPPLLVMDAGLLLRSTRGTRTVAVKDFFVGPHETQRKRDELIVEIHVPTPKGKTVFVKLGRRQAMTLSVANAAVRLEMDGAVCRDARIALGAMAPTPLRCMKAEGLLAGQVINDALLRSAAARAVAETSPIDDARATAWYRKKAGEALLARALAQASNMMATD